MKLRLQLCVLLLVLCGCSGGGGGSFVPPPDLNGTWTGTYQETNPGTGALQNSGTAQIVVTPGAGYQDYHATLTPTAGETVTADWRSTNGSYNYQIGNNTGTDLISGQHALSFTIHQSAGQPPHLVMAMYRPGRTYRADTVK